MAFKVIRNGGEVPRWCATDGSSTYYIGQLVAYSAASKAASPGEVVPLAVPAGDADTTNFQVIAGVVVGINSRYPTSNSTGVYAAGVTTQAAQLAREWTGVEGMHPKGDPQVFVQIQEIYPHTEVRANIYNAAIGTAPTVVTDSDGTDTTGYTTAGLTGACDFTPVANLATMYCRTGANAGLYRVTKDTSTTAPQTTVAFPYDVAQGDGFVRVPVTKGLSKVYIGGPGLYIDCSDNGGTNGFHVLVTDMNLTTAGKETADFRFSADHFSFKRA